MGCVLEVDLTSETMWSEPLDERLARRFIGGKGLGAKLLWDGVEAGIDPLGPQNPLIFITGPLTGTLAPTSARFTVVTKSPLTGIYLDSHVGGYWGPWLKFAGFDCLIVGGKASKPTYLWVHDGEAELKDATWLWGKGCWDTEKLLREVYPKAKVASIGPAGEHLVRYACITTELYRHAGRGGAGAVAGSKRLKAVVVEGNKRPIYANPERFKETVKKAFRRIRETPSMSIRRHYGTPYWVKPMNQGGLLPTRNFSEGVFEEADQISAERLRETLVIEDKGCYNCPVKCGKLSRVKGKYGCEVEGPEYETIALLGSNCGIGSLEAIAKANALCDDLGLDTISTGNVLGFTAECGERGLIETKMRFGDADEAIRLIGKIAYREGAGDTLAEGVWRISKKVGGREFAMHVKGMEIPGYDPRGAIGMALAYATSDRGACHQRAWSARAELQGDLKPRHSIEGRARFIKEAQDERAACFSLVLCDFMPFGVEDFVDLLKYATGFDYSQEEYLSCGERIWNLARLFNCREGIQRKDDALPKRFGEAMPEGEAKGIRITQQMLDQMLDEYYELRGWDQQGVPTREKLDELGLL